MCLGGCGKKHLHKGNLGKEGSQPIIVRKPRQQELEAANCVSSVVRKNRVVDASVQIIFSTIYSPGSWPREWSCL